MDQRSARPSRLGHGAPAQGAARDQRSARRGVSAYRTGSHLVEKDSQLPVVDGDAVPQLRHLLRRQVEPRAASINGESTVVEPRGEAHVDQLHPAVCVERDCFGRQVAAGHMRLVQVTNGEREARRVEAGSRLVEGPLGVDQCASSCHCESANGTNGDGATTSAKSAPSAISRPVIPVASARALDAPRSVYSMPVAVWRASTSSYASFDPTSAPSVKSARETCASPSASRCSSRACAPASRRRRSVSMMDWSGPRTSSKPSRSTHRHLSGPRATTSAARGALSMSARSPK
eukprot:scaffold279_cov116-Isochrysis_galbana.AAC.6